VAVASPFAEALRDMQCNRDRAEAISEPFSLGGGGHALDRCQAECARRGPDCNVITFYHSTGFCHFFRSCQEQLPASDGAVIYARV